MYGDGGKFPREGAYSERSREHSPFGIGLDSIAHFLEALDMFPDRRSCNAKVIGQVLARYGLG